MTAGIILAGGQSRRMGQNKALMPLAGRTLIQRVLDALAPLCQEIVIVTNTPERYAHLDVRTVSDVYPETGSLGGLYSGLRAVRHDPAIAVACDLPFLNTELLAYLVSLAGDSDAVVPDLSASTPRAPVPRLTDSRKAKQLDLHPLHAVYRQACLAPIEAQLQASDLRVIGFLDQVHARYVARHELERFDPELHSFFNANTPEEWAQAKQIARERGEIVSERNTESRSR